MGSSTPPAMEGLAAALASKGAVMGRSTPPAMVGVAVAPASKAAARGSSTTPAMEGRHREGEGVGHGRGAHGCGRGGARCCAECENGRRRATGAREREVGSSGASEKTSTVFFGMPKEKAEATSLLAPVFF